MATKFSIGTYAFPQVYDTFAIAEMVSTVSMSSMASSENINPNISTLHVAFQGPPGEWRVVQDYREKSVLSGLSAAGGLGSFFSLLCAVLFGTSLFSVIFRKFFICFMMEHSISVKTLTGKSQRGKTCQCIRHSPQPGKSARRDSQSMQEKVPEA